MVMSSEGARYEMKTSSLFSPVALPVVLMEFVPFCNAGMAVTFGGLAAGIVSISPLGESVCVCVCVVCVCVCVCACACVCGVCARMCVYPCMYLYVRQRGGGEGEGR